MPRWDIFCRVVDNFGDIGTCWRLARQLAHEHGADVRLWVDRLESFAGLCPSISTRAAIQRVGAIEVRQWPSDFPEVTVADVVIEAFACEIPANYLAAMARRSAAPAWINLEYLSAEAWVEDCHLLTSPHSVLPLTVRDCSAGGTASGGLHPPLAPAVLTKHFFFPGFTSQTGGLLRERDLLTTRAAFGPAETADFKQGLGIPVAVGSGLNEVHTAPRDELLISLFCYPNPALPELLQCWADGPRAVRVLATPGAATEQVAAWFEEPLVMGKPLSRNSLTVQALPFLSQPDYDRLLWACDVNFVRGEDSFVRAQWAQRPFVWQIYPQSEGTHLVKLEAFLSRYLDQFQNPAAVRRFWLAWNGAGDTAEDTAGDTAATWRNFLANCPAIQRHAEVWACHLDRTENLANNLSRFVQER